MSKRPHHIGDYEVLSKLASGGMGQVFVGKRAGAHGFEKLVAIKTMLEGHEGHEAHRRAFLDEAKLLSKLDHPAIAQTLDFGEVEGALFLVLEYVAGVSLAALLSEPLTPLPPRAAAELFAQVCRGLNAAHVLTDWNGRKLGVIHRDISPQNILVSFSGAAKLIDFGIAFTADREQPVTQMGRIKGKPAYMAPEQWKSLPIDHRVDIFSTGVVLYEALTGARLFQAESAYATGMAVCNREIPAPSRVNPALPASLEAIVLRALQRDPQARFQSAESMARALEAEAPALGKEALTDYVKRATPQAQSAHRAFLQGLGTGEAAPTGRPEQVKTQVAAPPDATLSAAVQASSASAGPRAFGPRGPMLAIGLAGMLGLFFALANIPSTGEAPPEHRALAEPAPSAPLPAETLDAGAPPTRTAPPPPKKPKAPRRASLKRRPSKRPAQSIKPKSRRIEPAGFGELTILAEPYATIRIDGQLQGSTPRYGLQIATGEHTLELIHPADGQVRHRVELRLKQGESRTIRAPELR